jgi:colicin import membrane protein
MSEEQESSVLFSLKELMSIEEDRIQTEEEQRQDVVRAEEAARLAQEQSARVAEEARVQAEEERRRQDEQRQREGAARLVAIEQAEMAKAHAETENKARIDAMAAQQEHERKLVALRQDKIKKRLQFFAIGLVVLVIAGGGIGGYMWMRNLQEQQVALQQQQEQIKRQKENLEKERREREEQDKKIAELTSQLGKASSPEEFAKLKAELDAARKAGVQGGRPGVIRFRPGGGGKKPRPTSPGCAPGDPLCGL